MGARVREMQTPAVRVVHDEQLLELTMPEEAVEHSDVLQRRLDLAAYVAQDSGVAKLQSEGLLRVDAPVAAGHDDRGWLRNL